jgi:hypothetical protein
MNRKGAEFVLILLSSCLSEFFSHEVCKVSVEMSGGNLNKYFDVLGLSHSAAAKLISESFARRDRKQLGKLAKPSRGFLRHVFPVGRATQ